MLTSYKRPYIAGPIRGIKWGNADAFDAAEEYLKGEGMAPYNPIAVDRELGYNLKGMPEDWDWWQLPSGWELDDIAQRCLSALIDCDSIYLLEGWERSAGARAEAAVAWWLRKGFLYHNGNVTKFTQLSLLNELVYDVWVEEESREDPKDILEEALEITKGDRQAQYGPPDQDFARTAKMWEAAFGWDVRPDQVAAAQILLKVSRQQHQRKRDNWCDIAGYARCGNICDEVAQCK